jgi:predicted PurR-regulated permease PerM
MMVTSPGKGPGLSVSGADAPPSIVEMAVIGFVLVVALFFGQAVLVPLALAVILSFILAPPVRLLRRMGLPNSPSVFIVVILAFAIIFGVGAVITQQVAGLAREIPRYQLTLKDKIKSLKDAAAGSGGAIERASATLKDLQDELDKPDAGGARAAPVTGTPINNGAVGGAARPIPVEVHTPAPTPLDQLQAIIGIVIAPLATAGITILFVVFLLMQRLDVRDRAIRLLGAHDLEKSTAAMDDAGQRLSQYFLAMTAINSAYGVTVGTALWLIGVPSPALWGVLAMLMRFVPFIGSFIAAALPLLLAAAVDSGWSMFLWTLALYVIGELVMGNVIEPVIQGHRTGLSPLAIVLSAAFWTLLWGPIGLLLAIPLTVVLVVLGRHVERLEFLHVLLGDTPPLSPPERFYQRMLAGDPAEPVEQAERFIHDRPLVDYYDEVVIEGLRLAQADADRGTLDAERLPEIRETAEVVIDALSEYDLISKRAAKRTELEASEAAEAAEASGEADVDEGGELLALFAAIEPEAIPEAWRAANAVLCVANRTALDETAALALAQLLGKFGLGARVLGPADVKHGALRREDTDGARLICISALDVNERSAQVRFLARRLKRSAPGALLLGGFWKLDPDDTRAKDIIDTVAVDRIVQTLKDALGFCLQTATSEPARGADRGSASAQNGSNPAAAELPAA